MRPFPMPFYSNPSYVGATALCQHHLNKLKCNISEVFKLENKTTVGLLPMSNMLTVKICSCYKSLNP